jgi:pilus assembly protein FimV
MSKKAKATASEAAQEAAPAVDQTPEAPAEDAPEAPEAPEAPAEDAPVAPEAPEAPAEEASEESADSPEAPEAPEAPAEDAQAATEAPSEDAQDAVKALQASVEALQAQLQEMRDREEAREREAKRAQRLEKAGIPATLGSFIRDDADLEALNEALAGLAKSTPAPAGAASTPTLPTVGTKNPGGEVLSVDEMIARAEANGDHAALSSLKLAKLSAASNLI